MKLSIRPSYSADIGRVVVSDETASVVLGNTVTLRPSRFEDYVDCVGSGSNYEPIRYFNCKRCGAVGQSGVCEYCGSAEE